MEGCSKRQKIECDGDADTNICADTADVHHVANFEEGSSQKTMNDGETSDCGGASIGLGIYDIPDPLLGKIGTYLSFPSQALFAAAFDIR